jgi:hypothetical protein
LATHRYSQQQLMEAGKFALADLEKIRAYRGKHNRLGFAYQLLYVRLLNYFPQQQPFEIIDELLLFSALQLEIDSHAIQDYIKHRQHIARHQEQIRDYLGLSDFTDTVARQIGQFIFEEAQRIEQMTLLLAEAQHFLRNRKLLQPSEDTLHRLIVSQREKARQSMFNTLISSLSDSMRAQLDTLLQVDESRLSTLQKLKHPPAKPSPNALQRLAEKLEIIDETNVLNINITWLNNNYQRSLAKHVHRCSVHRLRKLRAAHRYTALVCFLWQTSRDTVDYMVDMHFKLVTKMYTQAEHQIELDMQKKRKNIKASLAMLKSIGTVLLDETISDANLRKTVFAQIERDDLQTQMVTADIWLTGKFSHVFYRVIHRFGYIRRFAPALLAHLQFEPANEQATHLLQALQILREMNQDKKRKVPDDAPLDFMSTKLQAMVAPQSARVGMRSLNLFTG